MYVVGADLKGILSTDYFNVKGPQLRAVVNSVRTLGNEEEEGRKRGISLVGKGSRWLRAISSGAAELGGDVMSKHTKRKEEGKGEPSDSAGEIELDDLFFGKDGGELGAVRGANPMHKGGFNSKSNGGKAASNNPAVAQVVASIGGEQRHFSSVPSAPPQKKTQNRQRPSVLVSKDGTTRRISAEQAEELAAQAHEVGTSSSRGDSGGGAKGKWERHYDVNSGAFYYEDAVANVTQWTKPEGF